MTSYNEFLSIRNPCSPNLDPENRDDALVTTSYAAPVAGAPRRGSCRCRTPSWPSAITFKIYGDGNGLRCSSHRCLAVIFPIHPFSAPSAVIPSTTPLLQTAHCVPPHADPHFPPSVGSSRRLCHSCFFSRWCLSSSNKRAVGAYRQESPSARLSLPVSPLLAAFFEITAHLPVDNANS